METVVYQNLYVPYFEAVVNHLSKTQQILDAVNSRGGYHAHFCDTPINFDEPFGAILWHRRTGMDFPLCVAARMCKISIEDMIKMELGWDIPADSYDCIMRTLYTVYGFMPDEWYSLYKMGMEYQKEKPMDLSYYLDIDLPGYFMEYKPAEVYGLPKAKLSFVRHSIEVLTRKFADGMEIPKKIIWHDGKEYPIEKIDGGQQSARLKTGGIGTRFSCWIRGQQRNICFENDGEWFVETPAFA